MKIFSKITSILFLIISFNFSAISQLVVTSSSATLTATQLVNSLVGTGVTVYNASISGAATSIGKFVTGATPTNLGLATGVVMSTGKISNIPAAASSQASTNQGSAGDAQLSALVSGETVYDASVLQFDFSTLSSTVTFKYVFGSEEYPEYVCSDFNDVFGFFVTGQNPLGGNYTNYNIALIPGTTQPVAINSINGGSAGSSGCTQVWPWDPPCPPCILTNNANYTNNTGSTIVFDGFTHVLTATIKVKPCMTYHIKLAIGDVVDQVYDSGVFIQAGSFSGSGSITLSSASTNPSLSNNAIENCSDGQISFSMANPPLTDTMLTFQIIGTATNGVDYSQIPTFVQILAGQTTPTTLTIHPLTDVVTEGNESVILVVTVPPCGFDTVKVLIQDNPPLTISTPPDQLICSGDQLILNAVVSGGLPPTSVAWSGGTSGLSYTVYPTGSVGTAFTYTATISDACASTLSDNTVVTIKNCTPCIANAGTDGKICGLTYNLAAITTLGDQDSFWSSVSAGAVFSNINSSTSSVTVPTFGTYKFVWNVTNATNISCSDTVKVVFTPTPTSSFTSPNPNCFSDNVLVTYTGNAIPAATYNWSFGGGNPVPATGQGPFQVSYGSAGNFTISLSVTDDGCTSTATSHSVNIPTQLVSAITVSSAPCAGSNGSVTPNPSGGTPFYTYTWNTTDGNPPSLAGSYILTVSDTKACTDTSMFTITAPSPIVVIPNVTNLVCNHDGTGSASVNVSGGTLPYLYSWSNNFSLNAPNQSGMQAGLYTVSVRDFNFCVVNAAITITEPGVINVSQSGLTNVSCFGGSNGTFTATATGGTAPLGYSVSGFQQANGSFTGLQASNNYTLSVMDAHNCIGTLPFTISQPTPLVLNTPTSTDITCFGIHNGTISATASGGTGSLLYSIGGTSQLGGNFSGLYPGNYTVTVTDNNSCTVSSNQLTLVQPPVLTVSNGVPINLTCNGAGNGSFTVTATGGIQMMPYQYAASATLTSATGIFSGLQANTYTVTVTDANSCTAITNPIVVTQPSALVITSQNVTSIPCFGNTATISVVANGGTNPLSYTYNGTQSAIGNFSGLSGGTYTVTVTDSKSCSVLSNTFTIAEPPLLTITSIPFTNITCNGLQNGTATINAAGGTTPYQYNFGSSVNQPDNIFSTLTLGYHVLKVIDFNGCWDTTRINITQPTVISVSTTMVQTSCNSGSDGQMTATATGGTFPYIAYQWTNPANAVVGNLQTCLNQPAGTYNVKVTDINSCTATGTATITQPIALTISGSVLHPISCHSGNDGELSPTSAGGTEPYSYQWYANAGLTILLSSNPTYNNCSVGTYYVKVTDSKLCTASASVSISQPTTLVVTPSVIQQVSCNGGSDGQITATCSGGTGASTYQWYSDASMATYISTGQVCANLPAGSFWVKATDSKSCTAINSISLTQPSAVTVNTSIVQNVSCNAGNDGQLNVIGSGGTPPYTTYQWFSNIAMTTQVGSNQLCNGLQAGTYYVKITDSKSCTATGSNAITEPTALSVVSSVLQEVSCNAGSNGKITATGTGGTIPYMAYQWYSDPGFVILISTGQICQNQPAGTYYVKITDSKLCTISDMISLTEPDPITVNVSVTQQVSCFGGNNGALHADGFGGTIPYKYNIFGLSPQLSGDFFNLIAGNYTISVLDSNNCNMNAAPVTITQPLQLIITTQNMTSIQCKGNTATINVIANGGTSPLSYSYNGQSSPSGTFAGLSGDSIGIPYTVTVTDYQNCTTTSNTFNVVEPASLKITNSSFSNVKCFGIPDGKISVVINGGTLPLQYSIITGIFQGSNTFSNLNTGNYTLTVTYYYGCIFSNNIKLTQPSKLLIDATKTDGICYLGTTGKDTVIISGGTPSYNILWSNGSTVAGNNNLAAGLYFVTVTDANNCIAKDTVNILQPSQLLVTTSKDTMICKNSQATIIAHTTGGTAPYVNYWNGISGSTVYNNLFLKDTVIRVTVVDANGCISNIARTHVNIFPDVLLNVLADDTMICMGTKVNLTFQVSGGIGSTYILYDENGEIELPYSFYPNFTKTYYFRANDNNCPGLGKDSITIYSIPLPQATINPDPVKGCQPLSVNFNLTTDIECSEFFWNFGDQNGISYSRSPQHIYSTSDIYDVSVTVKSVNGCSVIVNKPQLIEVYPKPYSSFTYNPAVVSIIKPEIQFSNNSTGNFLNIWSFGSSVDTSIEINPNYVFAQTGQYKVVLIVESNHGCRDTSIANVIVRDEVTFYVPTAFSPDNNGLNDVFYVEAHGFDPATFQLIILDRWGEQIYVSKNITEGWNGSVKKGPKGSIDTYTWIVSFNDLAGKKYVKTGPVTLIR